MKNLLFMMVLLLSVGMMAQQKPKEIKVETEVKTIKVNDGERVSEKRVKVITREENDVNLDANDEQKVNQGRMKTDTKVEKTVIVDNDGYETSAKATYYKLDGENYLLTPNISGFDIASDNAEHTIIGTAWASSSKGHYIVDVNMLQGMGYFDEDGNLVVEYHNKGTNQIESKIYTIDK